MKSRSQLSKHREALLRPSHPLLAFFLVYLRWYLRRHFHGLRVAHAGRFPVDGRPLILCINHASWWDPLTAILLARHFLPNRDHYAPIDAAALQHYGFLRRLGLFPIETGTPRGAAQFLRAAMEILIQRKAVLWITPQGSFTDVRRRPVVFRSGLAALVARLPSAVVVPIAIEYPFWDERLPEIVANIGEPISFENGEPAPSGLLKSSLAATQDELAALAIARDPAAFHSVLAGASGVGGVYQLWQQLRAYATGREYHAEHGSISRS